MTLPRHLFSRFAAGLLLALVVQPAFAATGENWQSTLTRMQPGAAPELPPARVIYNYGWSGITAATAEFRYSRTPENHHRFDATGGTIGLARRLWKFSAVHTAITDSASLRPLHVKDVEAVKGTVQTTVLTFTGGGVSSFREEREGSRLESKTRTFAFPDVHSINSAFLMLRSQALTDGSVYRFVVYPATSAYLCTLTVRGREKIKVPIGRRDAIKLDLQLQKIDDKLQLQQHKKFRRGTIWIADDPSRVVLRIETQVFIGKVFAELQSVQLEPTPQ
jgi:hypothetical protein